MTEKYFLYKKYLILKGILLSPSHVLFMTFCPTPSAYESRLWEIKYTIENKIDIGESLNEQVINIGIELIQPMSGYFMENAMEYLENKNKDIPKLKEVVEWELFRCEPVRYWWRECDKTPAYYTISFMGILGMIAMIYRKRMPGNIAKMIGMENGSFSRYMNNIFGAYVFLNVCDIGANISSYRDPEWTDRIIGRRERKKKDK